MHLANFSPNPNLNIGGAVNIDATSFTVVIVVQSFQGLKIEHVEEDMQKIKPQNL